MEGNNIFGVATIDMCLVSDLTILAKLKTSDFGNYKSHTCTRIHLVMYCMKMATHTKNDKLLIHYFQDILSGASLKWYMGLVKSRIQNWQDLDDAFLGRYKYNMDMAPDRRQL